ncbi:MAG: type II secretion system F family protein [Rhodomicrobium sp.]|nr:type II secretion system F family protein [Rhodomicrobium sp.]
MLADLPNLLPSDGFTLMLVIVGLMAAGSAMMLSGSGVYKQSVAKRIDALQAQAPEKKPGRAGVRLEERVSAQPEQDISDAEHRQIVRIFARLGAPAEAAHRYYQAARLALMLAIAGVAFFLCQGLLAQNLAAGLLATVFPAALGWFLPSILLKRSVANRSKAVSAGLPDALELLAVCIEAGLSLENGLQRVSTELKRSQPALAEELGLTWAEINILPNRDQALLNFADRVDTPSVRTVVSTLAQTLRYGTPLARSLRVVAADVRAEQLTALEEKANRLPALMTVPVMLFIMPTIFLIIGGPAALKLMDAFFK